MSEAGEAEAGVFGKSDVLKAAVSVLNGIPTNKLPKLISRIVDILHLSDQKPFSSEEEDSLTAAFELSAEQIVLAINTISFFFETTAYHNLSPAELVAELTQLELSAEQAAVFGKAWGAKGPGLIERLRDKSFFERECIDVNWRLNLQLAQSTLAAVYKPNAQFDFTLAGKTGRPQHVQMEMTHEELSKFYTQVEIIQEQLDAMT